MEAKILLSRLIRGVSCCVYVSENKKCHKNVNKYLSDCKCHCMFAETF